MLNQSDFPLGVIHVGTPLHKSPVSFVIENFAYLVDLLLNPVCPEYAHLSSFFPNTTNLHLIVQRAVSFAFLTQRIILTFLVTILVVILRELRFDCIAFLRLSLYSILLHRTVVHTSPPSRVCLNVSLIHV